jgi:TIR domain/WD40-like Beta Propeller Repeat
MPSPDIFLSYSREDQAVARRFAEAFEREGFSVWWDQALSAGEAFDRITEQALDEAKAVVVLWSKKSVDSRWVRAEATLGQSRNRLVPVMIEACRRPIMFELTHTADLSGWRGDVSDPDWDVFIDGLRKLVARPDTASGSASESLQVGTHGRSPRRRQRRFGWPAAAAIAALSCGIGGLLVWAISQRGVATAGETVRLSVGFAEPPSFWPMGTLHLAISRDGSRIAYAGVTQLHIRTLRDTKALSLDYRAGDPFFSPDGAWLGFFGEPAGLVKVPATGGTPVRIASFTERQAGAAWSESGWIVYATTAGVFRVAENGGEPELLLRPDPQRREQLYAWPELLPGDRALLLTLISEDPAEPPKVVRFELGTRATSVVLSGGSAARYASTGHLVYATGQKLYAIRFDPDTGKTSGAATPVTESGIAMAVDNGAAEFVLSASGTLLSMAPGTNARAQNLPVWMDRKGVETPVGIPLGYYSYLRISPEGQRIALDVTANGNRDIWVWDLRRSTITQLTNGPTEDMLPVWSLDGRRLFFASDRGGNFDVYSQAADGSGSARNEGAAPGTQLPHAPTPDGRQMIILENFHDLSVLDFDRKAVRTLLRNDFAHWLSVLSPDGRWLAYESSESGTRTEVFLRPYPEVATRREKISLDGGRYPMWGPPGSNELYYVNPQGDMMRVAITLQPALQIGQPEKLFNWRPPSQAISGQHYDVSLVDGRFLALRREQNGGDGPVQIAVALNWFEELRNLPH